MSPRAAAALLAILSGAPMQCPSRRPPELALEDRPGDALWQLAERFHAQGDEPARRATLTFLLERYPASRYAAPARLALGPASPPSPDASPASP